MSLGDGELTYVEAGRGEPIVLVHGGLQDYRFWGTHIAALAKRYRVIAYSRRNHFPNPTSATGVPDTAADLHGEDLAKFIEALKLDPVHVVAHSAGAHAALFFAVRRPDLLRSLSVNEPPATGILASKPHGEAALRAFAAGMAPAREAFAKGDVGGGLRAFADGVGGPGAYERRPAQIRHMMADNAFAHVADAISSRPRPTFTCEMARRIAVPTLVTTGECSPPVFHLVAAELMACLPKAVHVRVPVASHTVPTDNPAAYRTAILDFVGRN